MCTYCIEGVRCYGSCILTSFGLLELASSRTYLNHSRLLANWTTVDDDWSRASLMVSTNTMILAGPERWWAWLAFTKYAWPFYLIWKTTTIDFMYSTLLYWHTMYDTGAPELWLPTIASIAMPPSISMPGHKYRCKGEKKQDTGQISAF